MVNALGLLGMDGMAVAMDAVNTTLKTANVCLLSHGVLDPGRLALMMEGDLMTCRTVLDASSATAAYTGRIISRKEIGRPDDDTRWLVGGFKRQPKRPEQKSEARIEAEPEETQDASVTSESPAQLLTLLASIHQGMTAGGVAVHSDWSFDEARNALEQLFSGGALRKHSNRHRLKN